LLDGTAVTLAEGATDTAARLILATGVVDELPDLPGLRGGRRRRAVEEPPGAVADGYAAGAMAHQPLIPAMR